MGKIPNLRKQIEIYIIFGVLIIAIIYGIFRLYPVFSGPKIIINSPKVGEKVDGPTIKITGIILRAVETKIQGNNIKIDKNGNFSENVIISYPYTTVVIEAKDKYNKKEVKTLQIYPKD